jgi:hypothetical protein
VAFAQLGFEPMDKITISDWLIILATVSGPILAVQAQKFIERASERHRQRLDIFYKLMMFRATPLAPERIQALNMIDLEFRPKWLGWYQPKKDKAVTTAWQNLLDALNQGGSVKPNDPAAQHAINQQRYEDRTVELLVALSAALGFNFSEVQLKRSNYYPIGQGLREEAQLSILDNLKKLLAGDTALKMNVTSFPASEDALKLQEELQKGLLEALSGTRELYVKIKGQDPLAQ